MILAIFADTDLSVSGGITFHPVAGAGKPQMFRKRTVSNVTSKLLESAGGLPGGGYSKSHWEALIILNFSLRRDFLWELRSVDKLAGG